MGEYGISSRAVTRTGHAHVTPEHATVPPLRYPRLLGNTAFCFIIRFDLVFVICRYAYLILLHAFGERRYTSMQRLNVGLSWPRLSLPMSANPGCLCWSHTHYASQHRALLVSCVFLARGLAFALRRLHVLRPLGERETR
jgi:hypothetical protein